ncbi:MAG: MFS transporter [Dehalococcoidia bacterium]|nr:MFS transporter [Dehalococcoidia bacterium]
MASPAAPHAARRKRGNGLTAPGRPLASLRHRDFRFLLVSTMALQIGSWVQTIGQGWLVKVDLGGSATDLAAVALLRGAFLVLLSPFGGYLAGRYERRRQLMVYTTGSATIAAALALLVWSGRIEIWMVYFFAATAGIVEALAGPIRSLLVFDTAGADEMTNAVALNALGGNAMRVIGPAIGGALIGLIGTEGTFTAQAICLILAVALTSRLRPSMPAVLAEKIGVFGSVASGLAYVVRDRRMALIVTMAILPSVLVYPYVTFLPVFAIDVLKSDEKAYGYLAAAVGLGSLLGGGIVAVTSNRERIGPGMMWACFFYCGAVGLFSLTRDLWLAVAVLAVAGIFHSIYSAFNASLMQMKAAPEYRSRVVALQTMTWGLTPFAGLLMGRMIDVWGAPHVVGGWMVVAAAATLVITVTSRELRRI